MFGELLHRSWEALSNLDIQNKNKKRVLHFTSADLGFSGEIFGDDCGVLVVVVVCGGVPGSDADFSVSFCVQAIRRPYFLPCISHV